MTTPLDSTAQPSQGWVDAAVGNYDNLCEYGIGAVLKQAWSHFMDDDVILHNTLQRVCERRPELKEAGERKIAEIQAHVKVLEATHQLD